MAGAGVCVCMQFCLALSLAGWCGGGNLVNDRSLSRVLLLLLYVNVALVAAVATTATFCVLIATFSIVVRSFLSLRPFPCLSPSPSLPPSRFPPSILGPLIDDTTKTNAGLLGTNYG